ncbi:MAG: carbohydrate kinase, partial [Actinobacteria bacterium]|nr:carbohydrate kinase [Actinomycetota bacterium]
SFCGGVLTQLWERGIHTPGALATVALAEWREIVAFAIRVAGITVQRVGADPPRRDEL